jgi:hypothetical protein
MLTHAEKSRVCKVYSFAYFKMDIKKIILNTVSCKSQDTCSSSLNWISVPGEITGFHASDTTK